MSALPQRKKSAEEIARLREEMGLPSSATNAPAEAPSADAPVVDDEPPRPRPAAKAVRSLRRSERQPAPEEGAAPVAAKPAGNALPARRHSDRELDNMRRHEAMTAANAGVSPALSHLQQSSASPLLLGLGYALALAGGVGAFPVALYIARKKPFSRHHAGFMAMIAVLVVAFGALYLFPNLNPVHAS